MNFSKEVRIDQEGVSHICEGSGCDDAYSAGGKHAIVFGKSDHEVAEAGWTYGFDPEWGPEMGAWCCPKCSAAYTDDA